MEGINSDYHFKVNSNRLKLSDFIAQGVYGLVLLQTRCSIFLVDK